MKNLKIGSVAGIGIFLHWTFLLLVAAIFAFYYWQSQSMSAALAGLAVMLAVFVCVILHELGHALTARYFDVPTESITLYPIGGLARLERIPDAPLQEFWIAVAGPAVNVVIALALAGVLVGTGGSFSPDTLSQPGGNTVGTLMWVNLALAGFNLLPAFPMDGGRVLRSLLALKRPYPQATRTAAKVGQAMAILFGLVGLLSMNPILLFIALFVYVGAQQESQEAVVRTFTEDTEVQRAMMTRFVVLHPDDTLDDAIAELLAGTDHDFPIVDGQQLLGLLRRTQLISALSSHDRDTRVREVADDSCFTVAPDAPLFEAFQRMNAKNCSTVPVLEGDRLVGLLTKENVSELVMITSAMRTRDASRIDRSRSHASTSDADSANADWEEDDFAGRDPASADEPATSEGEPRRVFRAGEE